MLTTGPPGRSTSPDFSLFFFWLSWAQAFSSFGRRGSRCGCGAWGPHCGASLDTEHGLYSVGSIVVAVGLVAPWHVR